MTATPSPDQPVDAALKQKIISLDKGTQKGIVTVQVGLNDLMQLFREHERQAVQKELRHLGNLIFQLQQEKGDNSIFDRILIAINDGLLQATQPPAADTTKQGEGE